MSCELRYCCDVSLKVDLILIEWSIILLRGLQTAVATGTGRSRNH